MQSAREFLAPEDIIHRVILFRIHRCCRKGANEEKVYECTRGVWRIGAARERAEYAFGVVGEIVCGVYAVNAWFPAGTTKYNFRSREEINRPGRWEFVRKIAPPSIIKRYWGKSAARLFNRRSQSPFFYLGDWD